MNRTPGKWDVVDTGLGELDKDDIEIWADVRQTEEGSIKRTTGKRICGNFENKIDAAYIVRAVNCHERMVDAAMDYLDTLIKECNSHDNSQLVENALKSCKIMRLLADAKGKDNVYG